MLLAVSCHFHSCEANSVNKKISLGLAISSMALVAALTFILTMSFSTKRFNQKVANIEQLSETYGKLEELAETVDAHFYKDADDSAVLDGIMKGYIHGLDDRYSNYMNAEDYTKSHESSAGTYTGIGITVTQTESGEARILEVAENSPAEENGLKADDLIVKVGDIIVAEQYQEALDHVVGEAGTRVYLTVRKADTGREQTLSIQRRVIDEITITYEMLEHNIGYIRITKFRTVTADQFHSALTELRKSGAKAILFDVRNNGGGLLSVLEEMVDPLLPEGDIAYAYYKSDEQKVIVHSDENMLELPFAVLMNGNTASAAELFACSLRDYADAILVGEKSYGKGIMQTTYPLSDGSAVTLTTATYATGKTPCYHEIGLEPDVLSVYDESAEEDNQLHDAHQALLKRIR